MPAVDIHIADLCSLIFDFTQDSTNIIYEPWHFRYVGVENAKAIQESGLCLEEYVCSLS